MTKLTVNDRPVEYKMDSNTPLLWALRDASNLTGTKFGCGQGDCGACIVDIDGEALKSCMVTLAEAEGRFVTTIEKLSVDRSHPLQQAFVAAGAVQCGFCTPGMIMAASALLKRNANPTDADIDEAIANICRCGVYPRVRDAVQRAARVMRRESTLAAVPPPGITPEDAAAAVRAIKVRKID